jgi:hypothetical protein
LEEFRKVLKSDKTDKATGGLKSLPSFGKSSLIMSDDKYTEILFHEILVKVWEIGNLENVMKIGCPID